MLENHEYYIILTIKKIYRQTELWGKKKRGLKWRVMSCTERQKSLWSVKRRRFTVT